MDIQSQVTATKADDGSVTLTTTAVLSAATVAALLATTAAGSGTVATGGQSTGAGQSSGSTGSAPASGTSSGGAASGSLPSSLVALWFAPDVAVVADGSATWTDRVGGLVAKASAAVGAALKDGAVTLAGKGAFVTGGIGKIPVGSDASTVVVIGDNEGGAAVAYGNPAPHAWRKVGAWQGGKFYLSDYDFNPEVPQQLAPVGGGVHEVRVDFSAKQAAAIIDGKQFGPWTMLFNTVADKLYLGGSASGEYMTGSLKCVMVFDGTIQAGDPDRVKAALGISSGSNTTTAPSGSSSGTSAGQSSGSSGTGTSGTGSGSQSASAPTSGSSQGSTPSGSTGSGTASTGQGSTSGAGSNPTSASQSSTGQGSTTPSGSVTAPTTGNDTGGTPQTVPVVAGKRYTSAASDPSNLTAFLSNGKAYANGDNQDPASSTAAYWLSVEAPFKAFSDRNQEKGYGPCNVDHDDTVIEAVPNYVITGRYKGLVNCQVWVNQDFSVNLNLAADGTFKSDPIDLTKVTEGPVVFFFTCWDVPPGGAQKCTIRIRRTIYLSNPAKPWVKPDAPAQAAGMKLILDEDFTSMKLDPATWQLGVQANGAQWGGYGYYPTASDADKALAAVAYAFPMPGVLRLRALKIKEWENPQLYGKGEDPMLKEGWHQDNLPHTYRDPYQPADAPLSAPPRSWITGLITTGMVGKSPSAAIRKGVVEVITELPDGQGPWPSWWGVNAGHVVPGSGAAETDYNETSVTGVFQNYGGLTPHVWPGGPQPSAADLADPAWGAPSIRIDTGDRDTTRNFLRWVYDQGETTIEAYVGGVLKGTCPMPRPGQHAASDRIYLIIDNAIDSSGWTVTVPPSGYYDMYLRLVRMWSAD